jgi:superoxide dismutase, Cu-Zn family
MNKSLVLVGPLVLGLAACATRSEPLEPAPSEPSGPIELRDASGRTVATATVGEAGGVRVRLEATALAPGTYGVHIHDLGQCEPPGFESAGPHWNPTRRQHGRLNPSGPHLGDLPNLSVGTNGGGAVEFTIAGADLHDGENALFDEDGAALVVHAGPDDYRTDPSGNSGARIACGVIAEPT